MSLVAYGSSDESSDDEGINCDTESENTVQSQVTNERTNDKLHLPMPKYTSIDKTNENDINEDVTNAGQFSERIHFDKLPKPKTTEIQNVIEDDDDIPPKKDVELKFEKPVKKDRAPVKITVPSLSEFKDLEKESDESKSNKMKFSTKGSKLFALLPPPKDSEVKGTTTKLVPCAVNKAAVKANQAKVQSSKTISAKSSDIKSPKKASMDVTYDSEDEDAAANSDNNFTTDFFSLTTTETISDSNIPVSTDVNLNLNISDMKIKEDANKNNSRFNQQANSANAVLTEASMDSKETLVTNVMNLPKEEILLKNQVEVGPKLPVPEQEYNVDTEGNVAFDDKAIEYLCGKRGVKRKTKEIEEVNVMDINWDDIKPDEREWLVKPLTEDPIRKPISVATGGVSSRKKHHITYLANQAKAIEMELKNQWAQNRLTRKQTQSKYGF